MRLWVWRACSGLHERLSPGRSNAGGGRGRGRGLGKEGGPSQAPPSPRHPVSWRKLHESRGSLPTGSFSDCIFYAFHANS